MFDAFLDMAKRYPDHPAIVHNSHILTYAELCAAVYERARRLGSRPGVVAVSASRSPDTIVALLAIWAAGGTYCPIDPAFPHDRQIAMRAAAGCGVPGSAANDLDPPAYILFTSGSTGEQKPVVIPRGAIDVAVASLRSLFELRASDRVLQFASLNWDTCFEEILPALAGGSTLVFHDEAYTGSFRRFLRAVEQQKISVLDLPTAFWHELVLHLSEEHAALPDCVRLVVIGGEAVNPARLTDWRDLKTGHIRLLNTYGCTETTLVTHAVDLHGPRAAPAAGAAAANEPAPLGRALPHVTERVRGDGELLIGGPAIAVGYKNLPEPTRERFVELDGERFFRTGDRVRRAPDGLLYPEGRLDAETKIRGIRVNPAEVEAHIAACPGVNAVAVTPSTLAGRTALVAYVVARTADDGDVLGARVTAFLRDRVPGHLIPSRVRVVSHVVYTTSGKVDRARTKEFFDGR